MPRPDRGSDRPPRAVWPKLNGRPEQTGRPKLTRRRIAGAAALLGGLVVPAGVFGDACASYYGARYYSNYSEPVAVSAGYAPVGAVSRRSSYAPVVRTEYATSYYGGTSYEPVSSYYGGTGDYGGGGISDVSYYGDTCGGGASRSSYVYDAGAGTCGPSYETYGSYGSSCGTTVVSGNCTPCPAPPQSCPADVLDRGMIESPPAYADPPPGRTPRTAPDRPPARDREPARDFNDRDRDDRDRPDDSEFDLGEPFDRGLYDEPDRPIERRRDPEGSVGGFADPPDNRPVGNPYSDPYRPSESDPPADDFGDLDDPTMGAADFGDRPEGGVRPAENVRPYRGPSNLVDPPEGTARQVPGSDEPFPELDAPATGNFEGAAPDGGAVPGEFGDNPGGLGVAPGSNEPLGGDPARIGQPGDGAFFENFDAPVRDESFGEEFLPDDDPNADDAFGGAPAGGRRSFRLTPNEVDLTGPPLPEEDEGPRLTPPDEPDADPDIDAPDASDGAAPDPGGTDAAALPRLITGDLLRRDLRRTRLADRTGRTRIARFRYREAGPFMPDPSAPGRRSEPGGADLQIANK